ncbi:MAG TPA: preprotein translocase subunit YajC [Bacteroidia bacterium]|nr:preprotein translocase subunit YajC [Bacteroidia bacterium]
MTPLCVLLQSAPPGGGMQQLLLIVVIIVIFYFFMIRPQMRKAKLEKEFRETIKKGDKIITIGGIHGKVLEITDTTMLIEVDNNVKMRVERSAVSVEATKTINAPKKEEKK